MGPFFYSSWDGMKIAPQEDLIKRQRDELTLLQYLNVSNLHFIHLKHCVILYVNYISVRKNREKDKLLAIRTSTT